jgi:hypothetical protein
VTFLHAHGIVKVRLTLFFHIWVMSVTDIPLFSMLRGRLNWLSDRQRVISENVANADTPGYVGRCHHLAGWRWP